MKNGALKIEHGIPIGEPRRKPKGAVAIAMLAMKKGDSFFVHTRMGNLHAHAMRYLGKGKYAIRAEKDGYRVWRTA